MKKLWSLVLCNMALFALPGCGEKAAQTTRTSEEPRIAAGTNPPAICCWFVENDGAGQHGYAAIDARSGYEPPRGGGLFPTINDLKRAIEKQNLRCTIEPNFGGVLPPDWRIRDLTAEELRILYSAMKKVPDGP